MIILNSFPARQLMKNVSRTLVPHSYSLLKLFTIICKFKMHCLNVNKMNGTI